MNIYIKNQHTSLPYRLFSAFVAFTFIFSLILPPGYAQVAPQTVLNLPVAGSMIPMTNAFHPALVKGITIHPDNPLRFDFIVDTGQDKIQGEKLKEESTKMIKYFLAALTVPEEEMWVNLSPYEKDRIIPQGFGDTEMGRDLLAQDYLLKQLTSSLMYPEDELGQEFWERVYTKAREEYGTTEIPMNTFNKVWIIPEKAIVYEHENSAFVVDSHLKVILEEDYIALEHNQNPPKSPFKKGGLTTNIIRQIILPKIEREINQGKTFANLRQIYNSMILATWYKINLKESLLGQVYVDKNKTKGVDTKDKQVNQKIYNQYLEAFKKGIYDYIREDYDPHTQSIVPRKYVSGGISASSSILSLSKILAIVGIASLSTSLIPTSVEAFSGELQKIDVVLNEAPLVTNNGYLADMEDLLKKARKGDLESIYDLDRKATVGDTLAKKGLEGLDVEWYVEQASNGERNAIQALIFLKGNDAAVKALKGLNVETIIKRISDGDDEAVWSLYDLASEDNIAAIKTLHPLFAM